MGRARERRRKKLIKILLTIIVIFTILVIFMVGFILYGPFHGFRDWVVTVSMTSMSHQWIAKVLYSEEAIEKILENNRIEEVDEDTDSNSIRIEIAEVEEEEKEEEKNKEIKYKNEYEKQIFAKDLNKEKYNIYADEKDYRIIRVKGNGYTGYLAVVYNPSKIRTLVTSKLGVEGEYLTTMAEDNKAVLAINGGRFYDKNGHGTGAEPKGVTFSGGYCKSTYKYNLSGGLIGFNKNNVLVLSSDCSRNNADNLNVRDCVCSGPFLIVNGKESKVFGNGGWGTAPRTAIGQRQDGVVLMLVLDGRIWGRPGASMEDIIEIMKNYGAYNAANLDGGTSTAMTLNYKIINDPVDASGTHRTRLIATGFGLIVE